VAQVATGDGLDPRQQERIESAVERVRRENGLDVSVLVGDLELDDLTQFRAAAERLHAALGERSPSAVLVVVAPGQRRVEVVTGPQVRRRVPDRVSALAVLGMTSAFRAATWSAGSSTRCARSPTQRGAGRHCRRCREAGRAGRGADGAHGTAGIH
jgi:uncharacterized membrane protein YgcG